MRISIRWWLSAACALVAAVTAIAGAVFTGQRAEDALRERAQDLSAGAAFAAAVDVAGRPAASRAGAVEAVATRRALSLWLFTADGRLASGNTSRRVRLSFVPERRAAVATATDGRRFISTSAELRATTVGIPLADGALLAYAPHPDVQASVGVVRGQLVRAAMIAIVAGGLVGFAVATMTARRLRRIAGVAASIESGDFEARSSPMFGDEVGELAGAIDAMRVRLRDSFDSLEVARERLHRLLERLHEAVVVVDGRNGVEFANRRARQLLQDDLVPGDDLPDPWPQLSLPDFVRSLEDEHGTVVERRVELSNARTFLVVGLAPRRSGEGVILVVTDVSERDRRERAEREFVTNAAHELRTPVSAILGAVDVLQSGGKDRPEDRDRFLSHIETAAARLARLSQMLLLLARVQTRQKEPELQELRVRPLLEEVATEIVPHRGVAVDIECDPEAVVLAEPSLIHHALLNLATNAAAHTARGRIVLASEVVDGEVVLEVRDTGSGIASDARAHIFERFYRASDSDVNGFGLGLAIVRQAVHAQRGEVELESVRGVGTTARLRLRRPENVQ